MNDGLIVRPAVQWDTAAGLSRSIGTTVGSLLLLQVVAVRWYSARERWPVCVSGATNAASGPEIFRPWMMAADC